MLHVLTLTRLQQVSQVDRLQGVHIVNINIVSHSVGEVWRYEATITTNDCIAQRYL